MISVTKAERALRDIGAADIYFDVLNTFRSIFPNESMLQFVRAPGRVNLIGEHTDYNGLPVLPMAINREIVIAFSSDPKPFIELISTAEYLTCNFSMSADIPHYEIGQWGNYAKAGAQAIWQWTAKHQPELLPLKGFRGCLGGTIPPGSGLSSSSALVVAIAVALVAVNDLKIGKLELSDLLAKGERYVGTEGGGMDQTVSIMAEERKALKIDFFPLRTHPVPLPANCVFVVANSMISAQKTGNARLAYNMRVAECKLGMEMLLHDSHLQSKTTALLKEFSVIPDWQNILDSLPDGPFSLTEIAAYTGLTLDDLRHKCLQKYEADSITLPGCFYPKERCRHVLTEGERVERAVGAMKRGDIAALGILMNESHNSCALDYQISCPELDYLVSVLRSNGAVGARLTGAGFGGCAVALVKSSDVEMLINGVWNAYYKTYLSERGINTPTDRDQVLFVCSPVNGAGIVSL